MQYRKWLFNKLLELRLGLKTKKELQRWYWTKVVPLLKNETNKEGYYTFTEQGEIFFFGVNDKKFKKTLGWFPKELKFPLGDFPEGFKALDFKEKYLTKGWKRI